MLAGLLLLLWLGGPPVQHPTQPGPLSWDAPAECPDLDTLRERVEALAPGSLEAAGERVRFGLSIEHAPEGYVLELVLSDDHGLLRRTVVDADCEQLTEVAALLIAVFLDPDASARTIATQRAQASATATQPEAARVQPGGEGEQASGVAPEPEQGRRGPAPIQTPVAAPDEARPDAAPAALGEASRTIGRDTTRSRTLLRGALRVVGGGGYGPTNTGTAMIGGAAALLGPRWRVELGAAWAVPRVVRPSADLGGSFDGWFVGARGCFVPHVGPGKNIELPLCPAVELGRVRGRGVEELPVVLDAAFTWLALGLGEGLWFAPLEILALGAEIQLAVPLLGGRFLIETEEVQRIAPVSVRGLAGLELRFPRRKSAPRPKK